MSPDAKPEAEILFELALMVGGSLDLDGMLQGFTRSLLRLLNGGGVHVLAVTETPEGRKLEWRTVLSMPGKLPLGRAVDGLLNGQGLPSTITAWKEWTAHLPLARDQDGRTILFFGLPDFGLLVLEIALTGPAHLEPRSVLEVCPVHGKQCVPPMGVPFLRTLQTILDKLAVACHACMEGERRRVDEQRLRESEERHRVVFEQSRAALIVLALPSLQFISANPAALTLFGVATLEEFQALGLGDISPERQSDGRLSEEKAQEMIATAERDGSNFFEWTHRRRDGVQIDCTVLLSRIVTAGQATIRATVRDISRQKRAERDLLFFREALENSTEAIGMVTPQGRHFFKNKSFDRMFGKIGENPPETLFVDSKVGEGVFQTIMSGEPWSGEVRMYGADRQVREVFLRAFANHDEKGQITGIVFFHTDITDRKRAEGKLRESEANLQAIMANTTDIIASYDREVRLVAFNKAFSEAYRRLFNVEVHSGLCTFDLFPEEMRSGWKANNERVLAGESFTGQFELPSANGGKQVFESSYHPIRQGAEVVGFLTTTHDITRHHLDEQFSRTLGILKQELLAAGPLVGKLRKITDTCVRLFGADFARVWISRPGDLCNRGCIHGGVTDGVYACRDHKACLHLEVSSGRYTHTDGGHRRVPFGAYKIGRIATGEDSYFLTNDVANDPRVHDHVWAASLKLVAFAGFRLVSVEGKPIGVLALFSRQRITPDVMRYLDDLATTVSQVIQTGVAEEALRETSARLTLATRAGGVGIWDWDCVSDTLIWDDQMYALYGISKDTFGGAYKSWRSGLHPDDVQRGDREIAQALSGECDFNTEFRVVWPDGSVHDIRAQAVIKRDSGGRPLRMVGTNWDITDRNRAEEALRESEAKLSALFASMAEMVVLHEVVFDESGKAVNYRITDCNAAYTRITGIRREDAVGRLASEMFGTPDPPYLAEFSRTGITGEPFHYESYFATLDKHFAVSVVSPGKNRFATIAADITEAKRIQAVIDAKNRDLEQLVYVASHDLRSPLVNVDGFGRELGYALGELEKSLAENGPNDSLARTLRAVLPDMTGSLRHIRSSTQRMDALLKGLLKLSRAGRAALTIADLDMNQLVAGVASSMEFQIAQAGAKLTVGILPPCRGDAVQIQQVFANLLDNAVKYRDMARPPVIDVSGSIEAGRPVYVISDNGIGIAPAHQEKIFELFHRLDPSRCEGEGIGLTIVRQGLARMDGGIRVESEPGVGSRFRVQLPPAGRGKIP